jgi:UDP-N-acetylmuramyl pentapeptide phosphotransferase/UDP-N-acetylglucosamine-1-phosphate transferase
MDLGSPFSIGVLAVVAFIVSALLTWAAIRYAHRHQLIDLPGQRRSHAVPTPRGGGIGIVASIVVCGFLPAFAASVSSYPLPLWWLLPPVAGVALVGWIDDHGGLPARTRFAMHCFAAAWIFGAPLLVLAVMSPYLSDAGSMDVWLAVGVALGVTIAIVWSINLHNFMDGINGILALQSIFVFSVLAALMSARESSTAAGVLVVWAAAVAGFLPFNFPRARIFMGDVGSGVLGLLVAIAVLWQITIPSIALTSGIVLCSAFVTDATCTLLSRMLGGRRWYSAHREHLYQWLVRCGYSHARVVAFYMGWNLLIVLPVVCWMNRNPEAAGDGASVAQPTGVGTAAAVYSLAVVLWWLGKRRCLSAVAARRMHADA